MLLREKTQETTENTVAETETPPPHPDQFANRHIGPDADEARAMLEVIGHESLEGFMATVVPETIRAPRPLELPSALSEHAALGRLRKIIGENKPHRSYLGMGYSDCIVPPVIQRNLLENPGWYTQYTPYQAEISQGRLEALLNFQTLIASSTDLPIANASLLDEGTAASEAMTMFFNTTKTKNKFFVSKYCHPQTIDILKTRAEPLNINLIIGDESEFAFDNSIFGLPETIIFCKKCVESNQRFMGSTQLDIRKNEKKLGVGFDDKGVCLSCRYFEKKDQENNNTILSSKIATVFRDEINENLPTSSTLNKKQSDFVGEINFNPNQIVQFDYNYSINNDLDEINMHKFENTFSVNNFVNKFTFYEENNLVGKKSFYENDFTYNLNSNNSLTFKTRENKTDNLTEYYNLIYEYKNDCLTASIRYNKEYYTNNNLRPSEELFFISTVSTNK